VVSIILVQIYHHIQNIHLLLDIFEELSSSSSKIFKFSKVHNIFIKFGVHNLSNLWNAENYTLWKQFWGTLMCFCQIPFILFSGSNMVISSSKCIYWVWSKAQVVKRYESRANVCEFNIHGCEVFTPELIPNKGWNDFRYLTHVYYDLWVMISLWMKMNQIHVQFQVG